MRKGRRKTERQKKGVVYKVKGEDGGRKQRTGRGG